MCGIVAYFGRMTPATLATFEEMLRMDVLRGKDSTGVAFIFQDGHTEIVKDVVLPHELMEYTAEYWELRDKALKGECIGVIGHNRYATKGSISVANAHPFQRGKITLVHNGTAWTYRLPNAYDQGSGIETDSERIANYIDARGIERAWPMLDGAMTLVYWNSEEKTFNLVTNGKRPMTWMYAKGHAGCFYASEEWMFFAAARRCDVELETYKQHCYPKSDLLYIRTIDPKTGQLITESKELMPWQQQTVKHEGGKRYEFVEGEWIEKEYTFPQRQGHWQDRGNGHQVYNPKKDAADQIDGKEDNDNVLPFDMNKRLRGSGGTSGEQQYVAKKAVLAELQRKRISKKEFMNKYDCCEGCGQSIRQDYKEAVIIDYDRHEALCESCAEFATMTNMPLKSYTMH